MWREIELQNIVDINITDEERPFQYKYRMTRMSRTEFGLNGKAYVSGSPYDYDVS